MEGSSSRDSHEGERGSCSPKKGKRSAEIAHEKPERMSIQGEMKRMFLRTHPSQPPAISGTGTLGLDGNGTNLQQPPQPQPNASSPPQRHHNFA
ncbi:hypothetical protein EJB05_54021, partial [Eragrostis curvula]